MRFVLLLMLLAPVFTMRALAEERRNQTLPLLLAAPVSSATVVLGKFVGLMCFLFLLMGGVPLMLYSLMLGAALDHGLMLANLLGLVLLAASFVALGLYVSALTSQPVVAAIGALAVLLGLWLADIGAATSDSPWHALSPLHHFEAFNSGLLDSGDAVFFLLFSVVFLLLTMRRIDNNRRYG